MIKRKASTLHELDFLIALGGNASLNGQPVESTINQAVDRLKLEGAKIDALSPFYRTPAYPPGSGPDFVNAAVAVRLGRSPVEMLELLHEIEADLGRRRIMRWGERTLDLDLLAAGSTILPDLQTFEQWRALPTLDQREQAPDRLVLPHPRLQDRAFVLVPLFDIAPDWHHPVLNRSVGQMLHDLPEAERAAILPM